MIKKGIYIASLVIFSIGFILNFLFYALLASIPSMAVADGVAESKGWTYFFLYIGYNSINYIIIFASLIVGKVKFPDEQGNIGIASLLALGFHLVCVVGLTLLELPMVAIPWFWNIFPFLHIGVFVLFFLMIRRFFGSDKSDNEESSL